jgi:putative flavoprotein involved in K+ transport
VLRYHCQENYFVTNFGDSDTREGIPQLRDGYEQVIRELNLKASGISTVIWATGYVFDFSLGETARTRRRWLPVQIRGLTSTTVYISWVCRGCNGRRSGILFGVGDDAACVARPHRDA